MLSRVHGVRYFLWYILLISLPAGFLGDNSTLSTTHANGTVSPTARTHKIPLPVGILLTSIGNDYYDHLIIEILNSTINEFNRLDGILDHYNLYMRLHFDKSVSSTLASLYDLAYNGQPVPILWGPLLSGHAIPVSEVITRYNITQVTLANSETLRDRDKYPYLNQIYPSINYLNHVRYHLMNLMGWKTCGIIFEDVEYWRTHMDDLINLFDKEQITVLTTQTIHSASEAPRRQIESLKQHDVRIIIVGSYAGVTAKILCEAHKQDLKGSKIVWIFPRWIAGTILNSLDQGDWGCSADELREMVELSLNVELRRPLRDMKQLDLNGLILGDDHIEHLAAIVAISDNQGGDGFRHNLDNLLVILLAMNSSIEELHQMDPPRELESFGYQDAEMRDVILKNVRDVNFVGSTDRVKIDRDGSRDSSGLRFTVFQIQDGKLVEVLYFVEGDQAPTYSENSSIQWMGSKPIDGKTTEFKQLAISTKLLFIIYTIVAIGSILAFGCLFVNIVYRDNRAMKLSSPTLNNLIVIGSIFLFAFVILLGIDVTKVPRSTLVVICHIETALLCVGISLSFGTLFVKTYRIYAIFTYAISKFKHIVSLKCHVSSV
ncbi:gamma-aminobutyric acid type B receptor subunit 2-like [Amphiura filiformis]|uniref:gamma-aminobutyric acid type B receptor subunit 2-like n=1 Tax=Amphiura filiformis TaxID=82378 RepID=UPI003B20E7CF